MDKEIEAKLVKGRFLFTDNSGVTMSREDVEDLAWINVLNSLTKNELVSDYVDNLDDDDILQWATNEEGNFLNG